MIVDRLSYTISMLQVYGSCIVLVLLLPMLMWRHYLRDKSLTERFFFCVITQTFFYVNVVLLLGFLDICNRWTMYAAIAIEYALVRWSFSERTFFRQTKENGRMLLMVFRRQLTWSYLMRQVKAAVLQRVRAVPSWPIWRKLRSHWFELLLLLACLVYNAAFLTHNVRLYHSYQFSDLPVHLSWVYFLEHGTLFHDGIYPFAMHAMIYTVRAVVGLDLREIILYFGSFQSLLMITSMFLLCRKVFFRWRWTAHLVLVIISTLLNQGRYAASLPQECGVFAMMAMAYYLIKYLNSDKKKHIVQGDSRVRSVFRINQYLSRRYLDYNFYLLALSVALVISFHFYTAIASVVLAVMLVLAYGWRFFRKQYLVPVVAAALLGAFLAVLPFGACLAKGIPFQESMEWAMSVINGEEWSGTGAGYLDTLESMGSEDASQVLEQQSAQTSEETPLFQREDLSGTEKVRQFFQIMYEYSASTLFGPKIAVLVFVLIAAALVIGPLLLLFKKSRPYGANYIALALYVFVILVFGSAQRLGLLVLFDAARASVFSEPLQCVLMALPLDILFFALANVRSKPVQCAAAAVSLGICAATGYTIVDQGLLHNYFDVNLAYYNEPDYLIDRIQKEYPEYDYTIISPTDEYYAVVEHGYHTELSEFVAMVDGKYPAFKIPTQYVFFFIEKYTLQDYFDGRAFINEEMAARDFIYQASTQDYYYQRNVIQSKAYYWAQAYQKMYPHQMRVYFEDDIYICYVLIQNKNSPLDMRIDYLAALEAGK